MMNITNLVRQKRKTWAGHVSRIDESATPQQVTFGEFRAGSKPQQKPKKRWILKNETEKCLERNKHWYQ